MDLKCVEKQGRWRRKKNEASELQKKIFKTKKKQSLERKTKKVVRKFRVSSLNLYLEREVKRERRRRERKNKQVAKILITIFRENFYFSK